MSENTEAPILSADDLLAVADFEWHDTEVLGNKTRQRALELDEWLLIRKRCPDVDRFFDGSVGDKFDAIGDDDLVGFLDIVTDDILGVGIDTAAYVVACSLNRGDDAEYVAALKKRPKRFLIAALKNVLHISFSEGGIIGFFTSQIGELVETAKAVGLSPKEIARVVTTLQVLKDMEAPKDEAAGSAEATPA